MLVYFGWPIAHEDNAPRAVHAGLGIVEAITTRLNPRLQRDKGVQIAVRIGIHTGPVVLGEMGGGGRQEHLATGDTVNIASRLEGLAAPNTVVISQVTARLLGEGFVLDDLGLHVLKGVTEPLQVFRVLGAMQPDEDTEHGALGVPFLVGRDEERGLLRRRWEQSNEGLGQVVLISGEAGIGKSALVDSFRQQVHQTGMTSLALRCSPYHTHSARYPIITQMQRALHWQPEDSADTKLVKLEHALAETPLAHEGAVPLLAALLSLPLPQGRHTVLTMSPQQQRQQTQDVLLAWLAALADRHPVLAVWEDLHWADASTLELLGLVVEQAPTARMLHVLTCRPDFTPPWPTRSHLTPITLNRLERPQVEALIVHLAGDKALPPEVVAHIIGKPDGVPLYVEELTKMLLAADVLQQDADAYSLTGPLTAVAIPETLQDSLMARLDQMGAAKELAQRGVVLGREFAYAMLQALTPQDEEQVQVGLARLVQAELLYQRGRPPRASYLFKHALIQDAAYASLLKSTRQQLHQRVAQLLETQFPELVEIQPELVAQHYTAANQPEAALGYWQRAGQHALQRSANLEAIGHLTQGLTLLDALPDTPERLQQELDLRVALGPALRATKGAGSPDMEHVYVRAWELCQRLGDTPHLYPVLRGLSIRYLGTGRMQAAHRFAEQLLRLAQSQHDSALLADAHHMLGQISFYRGDLPAAHTYHTQANSYNPQSDQNLVERIGYVTGVSLRSWLALELWYLGYPDQDREYSQAARTLAQEILHPGRQDHVLVWETFLYQHRREVSTTREQAEAAITLSTQQGNALRLAQGTVLHGWALVAQGQTEEGIAEIRQGLAAELATGTKGYQHYFLGLLAEAYGKDGRPEEGLHVIDEALALIDATEVRYYEAELHRLRGELLQADDRSQGAEDSPEACFQKALDIARQQQAKSLELRTASSLARLWQSQGKCQEAYDLLAPVYNWFTEGFDTADVQEAKVLLERLTQA